MAHESRCSIEKVPARIRRKREMGNQQEQRQGAQFIARQRIENDDSGLYKRRFRTKRDRQSNDPDKPQSHTDRHPRNEKDEQNDDADQACSWCR